MNYYVQRQINQLRLLCLLNYRGMPTDQNSAPVGEPVEKASTTRSNADRWAPAMIVDSVNHSQSNNSNALEIDGGSLSFSLQCINKESKTVDRFKY